MNYNGAVNKTNRLWMKVYISAFIPPFPCQPSKYTNNLQCFRNKEAQDHPPSEWAYHGVCATGNGRRIHPPPPHPSNCGRAHSLDRKQVQNQRVEYSLSLQKEQRWNHCENRRWHAAALLQRGRVSYAGNFLFARRMYTHQMKSVFKIVKRKTKKVSKGFMCFQECPKKPFTWAIYK